MTKKQPISPRKSPKQSRSRSLVESAVEAAARVLSRFGYDAASTNRVAETAGISIGSLYQYFPNKDALIGAVIDKQIENYTKNLEADFAKVPDLSPMKGIEMIVRSLVSAYLGNRTLLAVIFEQLPRTHRMKNILHARRHGIKLVKATFERNREFLKVRDIDHASYIIVNSVMGVLLTAIVDDQLPLSEKQIGDELIEMIQGYVLWDRVSGLPNSGE
jgi:AcrR family transcriptional regulator